MAGAASAKVRGIRLLGQNENVRFHACMNLKSLGVSMKNFAVIDALYILQHKDPHRPAEQQGDELRIRCPECQGPASFNRRKLVGRCFHCDMTLWFDSSSNPDDLFDTPQTSHSRPQSAPVEAGPVAVDEHPLSEQAYAYLARRGLRRSTVDRFPITETLYNDTYPKLVWTNRQGGKELRALDDTPPWQKMTARGHPKDLTYVDRQSQTTVIC